jgi:hypothetical protein
MRLHMTTLGLVSDAVCVDTVKDLPYCNLGGFNIDDLS